eukprot:m.360717 g.360717  ORF g.360717 m.360717 type:complete len:61 (-) comp129678_c0_seq1:21-203(-)
MTESNDSDKIHCISFGAPVVGDKRVQEFLNVLSFSSSLVTVIAVFNIPGMQSFWFTMVKN